MTELVWLKRVWVDAIHFQQLQRFGGLYGVRDAGASAESMARPRHQWVYQDERNLAVLAAAYGFGLTRSHGYAHGVMLYDERALPPMMIDTSALLAVLDQEEGVEWFVTALVTAPTRQMSAAN